MTSRPPYCFVETKKRQPYCILLILSSFLQHVTAAILVYSNNETSAILELFIWKSAHDHKAAILVKTKKGTVAMLDSVISNSFLHDVMVAILIKQNKETVAILDSIAHDHKVAILVE